MYKLLEVLLMNVTIRNLDAGVVMKLNEIAKKQGLSREEYLRTYLENLAVLDEMKKLDLKYAELVREMAVIIDNNTKALKKVNDTLSKYVDDKREEV
jgi:plasmid stability protein